MLGKLVTRWFRTAPVGRLKAALAKRKLEVALRRAGFSKSKATTKAAALMRELEQ